MTSLTRFLAPVLAVSAVLVATDVYSQSRGGGGGGGRGGGGYSGGSRGGGGGYSGGGHRGAYAGGGARHGGGYQGGHGGHYGNGGHYRGGHYGHGSHHGHGHWYGSGWGYYGAYWPYYAWGWPYYWGASWGYPYYDPYYYPREEVLYREVPVYRDPAMLPPPVETPYGPGAPTRGPTYMNYCESARAYFPKVTTCPEGWRLTTPG